MTYFVIGDEDTVLGFELVGIPGARASSPEEAHAAFEKALSLSSTGIIVITNTVADMIRSLVDRYLFTAAFPLIVEIPGTDSTGKEQRDLRSLVNQAIGIKLG